VVVAVAVLVFAMRIGGVLCFTMAAEQRQQLTLGATGLLIRGMPRWRERLGKVERQVDRHQPVDGELTRAAKSAGGKRSSLNLGDQVLALATGKTQQEITAACKSARPNHVGMALARHKRAGRIEERDGKLYATQSMETAHRAAI
jgi:hypothetical protein